MQSSAIIDTSSRERILTRRANQRHPGNLAQLARRVRPCSAGFPQRDHPRYQPLARPRTRQSAAFAGWNRGARSEFRAFPVARRLLRVSQSVVARVPAPVSVWSESCRPGA
jgi:hypothetical protein